MVGMHRTHGGYAPYPRWVCTVPTVGMDGGGTHVGYVRWVCTVPTISNFKKMNKFDEIIEKAVQLENDLYVKVHGERFFKIKRRCRKRIHLTCRKDSQCTYSIRYNIEHEMVILKELKLTHSCSVQSLSKRSKNDTIKYVTSRNFWKDFPTSQDYFAHSSHDNAGPRNALSSSVLYSSNDTSSRSSRDVALQSNDSSPTDEYVYPTSQDYFPTENNRNSVGSVGPTGDGDENSTHDNAGPRNALSSPVIYSSNDTSSRSSRDVDHNTSTLSGSDLPMGTTTQSDQVIIQTSTTTSTSDDDFIKSGDILPAGDILFADNVNWSPAELGLLEMIAELKKREEDQKKTKNELLETSKKAMHKYVDIIMAVCDDYVCSSDKAKVFKSLSTIVANQFGSSYVKDLFLSYSSANERNQLIFDLQLLQSFHFPEKYSTSNAIQLTPRVTNKRKLCNFFDDDFEEVIYVDK